MLGTMRRVAWVLPVLPVLPLACFAPGDPATLNFEGGTLPALSFFDASLPDVRVFSPAPPPSTPPPDGAPPVEAATPSTVTISVVSDFGAETGVPIFAADTAGNLVGTPVLTDVTGSAQVTVVAGGSVTAAIVSTSNHGYYFVTYMGVASGDVLKVLDPMQLAAVNVSVTNVPEGAQDNVQQGSSGNCGDFNFPGATPFSYPLNPGCYSNGLYPLLVVANGDGTDLGYVFQNSNPLAALLGGPHAGTLSIDLSEATLNTDESTQTIIAANAPAGIEDLGGVFLTYNEIANGVPNWLTQGADFGGDAGTASSTFTTHPSYPESVQSEVDIVPQFGDGMSFTRATASPYWSVVRQTKTPSGSETLDLSNLPPMTSSAGVVSTGSTVSVAWTTSGPVTSSIGTLVFVQGSWGTWTFVVPPGVTAITSPPLPPSLAASLGPNVFSYNIATLSGDAIPDYGTLRRTASSMVEMLSIQDGQNQNGGIPAPPLPNAGDLTITGYEDGYLSFFGES